jgi:ribosomal protein S12 methylthiotransferase accessory factor
MLTEPDRAFAEDFADVVSFRDHIALYTRPTIAAAAGFLTASTVRRPVADVERLPGSTPLAQIRAVCRRLAAQDVSAYGVDVTSTDIAAAGLAVAKVLAPELCALDVRHDARFLGGRRLYELPHRLGLSQRDLTWDEINPYPHPFP